MRLIPLLLILLLLPAVSADDLYLNITTEPFFSGETGTYKLIVTNVDGTAPEYINFTLEYWISDSDEIISGYPKTTENDLKSKRTISRQWTPHLVGYASICAKIISSTTTDDNSENDFYCTDVSVAGQITPENTTEAVTETQLENSEPEIAVNLTAEKELENEIIVLESQVNNASDITHIENPKIVFQQKPDTLEIAMLLFIISLVLVIMALLFKIYKGSNTL